MSEFENNDTYDLEFDTVTLTLEDDTELECAVLAVYEAGDHQYAALVPFENNEINEDAGVMIFRYTENADGEPGLENIESDEEYETACDAFDELLDEEEFEEGESEEK